jgi:hypothetical protein
MSETLEIVPGEEFACVVFSRFQANRDELPDAADLGNGFWVSSTPPFKLTDELAVDGTTSQGRANPSNLATQSEESRRFPGVAKALADLPNVTVIDGEIVLGRSRQAILRSASELRPRCAIYRALRLRSAHVAGQGHASLAAGRTSRTALTACEPATGHNPTLGNL